MKDALEDIQEEKNAARNVSLAAEKNSPIVVRQGAYDALVLEARLRQSLTAVRSLGSMG
jgi:hypothetical protein